MARVGEHAAPSNARGIWPVLWRGRYLILASVVAMVTLAAIYSLTSAKVYQATALIQVNVPNQTASVDTTAANQGLAQNFATLLVSPGFLEKIRPQVAGGAKSASELQSDLSAEAVAQTALVQLHSSGSTPQQAQRLGEQVARAFLAHLQTEAATQTSAQQSQIQQEISKLSEQISALQVSPNAGTPATADQISSLQASRQALITQNATILANGLAQGASASLSAPPAASSSPIKPRRSLDLIAGLLLGLLLGVALALLRELLSPGLRSADEAAALLDVPVLASIPLRPRLRAEDPVLPEAYDVLQTNLFFAMRQHKHQMVTFVGPNPRVGKTSVVEGLAGVASGGEHSVLVVDGDMRAGSLSIRLQQAQRPGMTELLQGAISLDEALVELEPGLSLLPSHQSPINAPSLLSGSRMRALSAEWRERFDIVLIDSPPIAGLADGLILASLSDAVVVVVRTGVTSPADLLATAASLRQTDTAIAGLVVFEERPAEPYYPGRRGAVSVKPDAAVHA
jgi:Mrp family chromosome partitioning ATPase/capsular polysaccharide biosynthesis protein